MLRNFFTIAFRNLSGNKFYSLINIGGLAIGIACFTLAMLYVKDELSYDRFHSKADNIYRVCQVLNTEGSGENSSSLPFPVGPALKNDFPEVIDKYVRFFNFQDPRHTLKFGDKVFNEENIYVTDSTFFDVFDFPLALGDESSALNKPNSIVLTEKLASKYFGKENPVGKIIKYEGMVNLEVTGVLKPYPSQTHMNFDALISFSSLRGMMGPNFHRNWVWNPCWTYILLKPGADTASLSAGFPDFVTKHYPDFLKKAVTHYLQPLSSIHLHSRLSYEMQPNSDADSVFIFLLIGIFILVLACINYTNLATARSASRAMEVGIRKVLGASRAQIMRQLLAESLIISMFSVVAALAFIELLLPFFNSISGKNLTLTGAGFNSIFIFLLASGIITGLAAGIYPAFFLSSYQPVTVLKKGMLKSYRGFSLRKILVVFQFTISLILITSTWVIYRQLNYLRSAELGFDKEDVVLIPVRTPMYRIAEAFKSRLALLPEVSGVTVMNDPIGKHHNTHEYNYAGMEKDKWVYFPSLLVDEQFIPTMKLELIAGRNFSRDYPRDDSLSVIINESMLSRMKWKSPEEAIGQQFFTPTGSEKIIGVVKDFHFEALHNPVGPFVLDMPHRLHKPFWTRNIAVRLAPGDKLSQLAAIEAEWKALTQEYPFDFFFLNDDLSRQYHAQEKMAQLFMGFTVLALFIACLGLLALSAYSAEARTREIGIRKALGASVASIVGLLIRDFLKLVVLANLIALPLTSYLMKSWLENFAFRISVPVLAFVAAAAISLIISLITVSFQSIRAAINDPASSLKYE